MPFKVTDAHRIVVETARVKAMLEKPEYMAVDGTPVVWEEAAFIAKMKGIGLDYSNPDLTAIRDNLVAALVIEVV